MTLTKWLQTKFFGLDLDLLAVKLGMNPADLSGIVNGTRLPDYYFLVQTMYFLNLKIEEQLELFYLVSEVLDITPGEVFDGVVAELSQFKNDIYNLKR